jgi:hypothetical protein
MYPHEPRRIKRIIRRSPQLNHSRYHHYYSSSRQYYSFRPLFLKLRFPQLTLPPLFPNSDFPNYFFPPQNRFQLRPTPAFASRITSG